MAKGKAIPYGTYDVSRDEALVNVGITHETAEFAVESIRRWWRMLGRRSYPKAKRLLVCADAGGSNGTRRRSWKLHLQKLSDELKFRSRSATIHRERASGTKLSTGYSRLSA